MAWFRRQPKPLKRLEQESRVPEGLWIKCNSCKEIIFKKPGGTLLSKSATFTNTGTDGKIEYKTVAGDIDEIGTWEWNPHVIISAGNEWYADPLEFVVKDKLKAA